MNRAFLIAIFLLFAGSSFAARQFDTTAQDEGVDTVSTSLQIGGGTQTAAVDQESQRESATNPAAASKAPGGHGKVIVVGIVALLIFFWFVFMKS